MTSTQTRHLILVAERMTDILKTGNRLKKKNMVDRIRSDPFFSKNFSFDCIYGLVGLAVRVYTKEFYQDRGDRCISLTLSAMKREREKRQEAGRHGRMMGTTAGARIMEAMEAAEG